MRISPVKHEVFSALFKIRSSLEILMEESDDELLHIAFENTTLLENILKRIFILQSLMEGKHSLKSEEVNPVIVLSNIFGIELNDEHEVETDPYLFEEGIKALKSSFEGKPSINCREEVITLEGKIKEDTISAFFLNFATEVLEHGGIKLEREGNKIKLSWERF